MLCHVPRLRGGGVLEAPAEAGEPAGTARRCTNAATRGPSPITCEDSGGPLDGEVGCEVRGAGAGAGGDARQDGVGGEVAAADGAFHGGGPAGAGVIAGEVQVFQAAGRRGLIRAEAIDAGERRKGGP